MKQYVKYLPRSRVVLVYCGIMFFGALLLSIQDLITILTGFALFIFGLHELGHILVLLKKKYDIIGIAISLWPPGGIGFMPDRPIDPQDSSAVYIFSGLVSTIVPFFGYVLHYSLGCPVPDRHSPLVSTRYLELVATEKKILTLFFLSFDRSLRRNDNVPFW